MPDLDPKHRVIPQPQTVEQPDEIDQAQQRAETVAKTKTAEIVSEPYVQKKKGSTADGASRSGGAPVIDISKFKFNSNEAQLLLLSMQEKMSEAQMENAKKSIQGRAKEQKLVHEERIKKLEAQTHKQEQADTGKLVAKIFGWIGAALALVGGIVGAIVTGGAAAAASVVVIVAAVATIAMMTLEETGAFDKMMEGTSPQAKMGVKMGIMAALMILNIAGMIMSGGASAASEAGEVAEMAEEAVEAATMVTEVVEDTTEAASDVTTAVTDVTEGVTDVTEGVTDVTEGVTDATEGVTDATDAASDTAQEIEPVSEEVGKEASDAAIKAEKAASRSTKLSQYALKAKKVTDAATAADLAAGGAAEIASSKLQYDASTDEADARSLKAKLLKMQSYEDEDRKRIQEIMESLDDAMLSVIRSIASTDDTISKAISHMKATTTA